MDTQYTEPVAALLTLGRPNPRDEWSKYNELGITQEHLPELLRMIVDEKLNWANTEDDTVYAPVYAWRILGNLRAAETVQPLLERFDLDEEDEWAQEDIPKALAMIGQPAFRPMAHYLADEKHPMYSRTSIAEGLVAMAQQHPELRQNCINRIERPLTQYAKNDPTFNGLLISCLIDLKAVEAMPVIQQAYQENCVDVSIHGDLEDVEMDLGLREKRSTPPPRFSLADYFAPEKKKKGGQRKIGRNDACPCGSGKKYKKCCMDT
ncbi:SEC-C motif-containing protein [Candidatus Electronema halotolerans]|jgi:hypothetical protein